jgi:hypothetical protein
MDVRRIKDLLHAWRPGQDVPPEIAQAREIASKDPALSAWLDSERAFDQAFADKLRDVNPPADLLGKILAEHESGETNVVPFTKDAPPRLETRRGQLFRYVVSMAASLVLVGVIFFFIGRGSGGGDDLASFVDATVIRAIADGHLHDAASIDGVYAGLRGDNAPVPGALPAELGQFQPAKYGSIATQNGIIGQIGFSNNDSVRLIVMERRCLGGCSKKLTRPVIFDLGDKLAVTWAQGGQVFILVSDRTGESVIRSIAEQDPAAGSF